MTTVLSHSHRKTLLMPAHHRRAHGLNASWAIRTRIFLMRTRIFLMRTCIYSFSLTSLPHLTWVNRSTDAHFTLFLLEHKFGREKILSLRSMLAMHTWICTFSHAFRVTKSIWQEINHRSISVYLIIFLIKGQNLCPKLFCEEDICS